MKSIIDLTTLPPLYSKTNNGKIEKWTIEISGSRYRTVSGEIDGAQTVSEWTQCDAKQSTTPEEQALKDAQSKWKKKKKHGCYENVQDVDKGTTYIKPMLALKYNDEKDFVQLTEGTWGIQNKFNGMRCVASAAGLFTRKGERIVAVPHIEAALKPFFDKYPNAVLDGELFNEELRQQLNEIIKLCCKTVKFTVVDRMRSEDLVRYYIYDGYGFTSDTDEKAAYKIRKEWIDKHVVSKYQYCVEVKTHTVKSEPELTEVFQSYTSKGHEGVILRLTTAPYKHTRCKYLLKMKPEDDAEGEILDVSSGSGNWSGKAKIITIKMDNGKIFNASFKGTMEEAEECLKNRKDWIGKRVTYKYYGFTGLGTPNYAQFDYKNCLKE